ncbi:hypothetical protein C8R46DRAFT_1043427 [Mycena filopes]|nr:hypothetical protein C8R46DRAFT_1043427 [Mycena filopes]
MCDVFRCPHTMKIAEEHLTNSGNSSGGPWPRFDGSKTPLTEANFHDVKAQLLRPAILFFGILDTTVMGVIARAKIFKLRPSTAAEPELYQPANGTVPATRFAVNGRLVTSLLRRGRLSPFSPQLQYDDAISRPRLELPATRQCTLCTRLRLSTVAGCLLNSSSSSFLVLLFERCSIDLAFCFGARNPRNADRKYQAIDGTDKTTRPRLEGLLAAHVLRGIKPVCSRTSTEEYKYLTNQDSQTNDYIPPSGFQYVGRVEISIPTRRDVVRIRNPCFGAACGPLKWTVPVRLRLDSWACLFKRRHESGANGTRSSAVMSWRCDVLPSIQGAYALSVACEPFRIRFFNWEAESEGRMTTMNGRTWCQKTPPPFHEPSPSRTDEDGRHYASTSGERTTGEEKVRVETLSPVQKEPSPSRTGESCNEITAHYPRCAAATRFAFGSSRASDDRAVAQRIKEGGWPEHRRLVLLKRSGFESCSWTEPESNRLKLQSISDRLQEKQLRTISHAVRGEVEVPHVFTYLVTYRIRKRDIAAQSGFLELGCQSRVEGDRGAEFADRETTESPGRYKTQGSSFWGLGRDVGEDSDVLARDMDAEDKSRSVRHTSDATALPLFRLSHQPPCLRRAQGALLDNARIRRPDNWAQFYYGKHLNAAVLDGLELEEGDAPTNPSVFSSRDSVPRSTSRSNNTA